MEELSIRLIIAVILGASMGLERELAHKSASMRTYALVSLGAALFVVVSQALRITDPDIVFDASRITAGVITGVGFIGAGLILYQQSKLTGLTTATGLWVAAGIGVACGFKLYVLAMVATILVLVIFTLFWFVENYFRKRK